MNRLYLANASFDNKIMIDFISNSRRLADFRCRNGDLTDETIEALAENELLRQSLSIVDLSGSAKLTKKCLPFLRTIILAKALADLDAYDAGELKQRDLEKFYDEKRRIMYGGVNSPDDNEQEEEEYDNNDEEGEEVADYEEQEEDEEDS